MSGLRPHPYFQCPGRTYKSNIRDLEKCVPSAGIYKGGKVALTLLYKVLVLDSILVDCDRKMIYWSCGRRDIDMICKKGSEEELDTEKVLDFFGNNEKLFGEQALPKDEHALDKMFVKAESIFQHLGPECFERDGNASAYEVLLEILDTYILPEISFQLKHQDLVQQVLDKIMKEIDNIEMLIEMNVQTMTNNKELLAKERKLLLARESVSIILHTVPRDEDFISVLLKHAEKDIQKLEGIVISLTEKVDAIRSSKDDESVKHLADTLKERDKISKEMESIVSAKEYLTKVISKRQVVEKRKAKRKIFSRSKWHIDRPVPVSEDRYEEYKRGAGKIETLNNDIKQQINIKIRLSTVKEAVLSALKYIQTYKDPS